MCGFAWWSLQVFGEVALRDAITCSASGNLEINGTFAELRVGSGVRVSKSNPDVEQQEKSETSAALARTARQDFAM